MYYLAIANVHRYMIDALSASVENQVARLHLADADLRAAVRLGSGRMGKRDSIIAVNSQRKAGAVCAVCQACSSAHIGISHKLKSIAGNG